jgi:apolipoprotein N-acyltransferase
LAATLDAPFAVGVTEEAGNDQFTNAQIVVQPDGTLASRYDKVRRVPFGEYMPMRGLLHALGAPTDLVPRNAIAGTGPAFVDVPGVGRVAVVISWEVFFGGRAHDGVSHGGQLIINPTNGSSYTGTILQSQQIASSRLRAIEEGRWMVQVAPTGFSAFVSPNGDVHERTAQKEAVVRERTIQRRAGSTLYATIGDKSVVALAAVVLGLGLWLARRPAAGDSDGAVAVEPSDSAAGMKDELADGLERAP